MSLTRRRILVSIVAIVVGVISLVSVIGLVAVFVGLPIVRTASYHAMILEYSRAVPVQATPDPYASQSSSWSIDLRLSNGATMRVEASDHTDVVRVHYGDESEARALYDYEDYSNPKAIRIAGNTLFVYWEETLLHTDCWLFEYDLENRREIGRRRVDPL